MVASEEGRTMVATTVGASPPSTEICLGGHSIFVNLSSALLWRPGRTMKWEERVQSTNSLEDPKVHRAGPLEGSQCVLGIAWSDTPSTNATDPFHPRNHAPPLLSGDPPELRYQSVVLYSQPPPLANSEWWLVTEAWIVLPILISFPRCPLFSRERLLPVCNFSSKTANISAPDSFLSIWWLRALFWQCLTYPEESESLWLGVEIRRFGRLRKVALIISRSTQRGFSMLVQHPQVIQYKAN